MFYPIIKVRIRDDYPKVFFCFLFLVSKSDFGLHFNVGDVFETVLFFWIREVMTFSLIKTARPFCVAKLPTDGGQLAGCGQSLAHLNCKLERWLVLDIKSNPPILYRSHSFAKESIQYLPLGWFQAKPTFFPVWKVMVLSFIRIKITPFCDFRRLLSIRILFIVSLWKLLVLYLQCSIFT